MSKEIKEKCWFCGKRKKDVFDRIDSYGAELYDDKNEYPICDDCMTDRQDSI